MGSQPGEELAPFPSDQSADSLRFTEVRKTPLTLQQVRKFEAMKYSDGGWRMRHNHGSEKQRVRYCAVGREPSRKRIERWTCEDAVIRDHGNGMP